MSNRIFRNHLRTYRRKAGLSQKEVGRLLGYRRAWQVSRHEMSRTMPPLPIALAYQAIYQVPVSSLFIGLHAVTAGAVADNLVAFEKEMEMSGKGRPPRSVAQKMQWLKNRASLA